MATVDAPRRRACATAASSPAFGYKQELDRSLGSFSSFAAGFSYISILTGVIELFGFGYPERRAGGVVDVAWSCSSARCWWRCASSRWPASTRSPAPSTSGPSGSPATSRRG